MIINVGKAYLCVQWADDGWSIDCPNSKTVRDKEGRGRNTPTVDDWVILLMRDLRWLSLLTEMNPCILIFSIRLVLH